MEIIHFRPKVAGPGHTGMARQGRAGSCPVEEPVIDG